MICLRWWTICCRLMIVGTWLKDETAPGLTERRTKAIFVCVCVCGPHAGSSSGVPKALWFLWTVKHHVYLAQVKDLCNTDLPTALGTSRLSQRRHCSSRCLQPRRGLNRNHKFYLGRQDGGRGEAGYIYIYIYIYIPIATLSPPGNAGQRWEPF